MEIITIFLLISLYPFPATPLSPSLNDDVLGLVFFKYDIQDPAGKLTSWNEEDNSPCQWGGVICSPRLNRVTELALDGFGLSGKLGKGLLRLKFLRKLSLSRNNFTGTLNPTFARISNLTSLDLSGNGFDGSLPNDFFTQCVSLRSISLARNKFSGPIPATLASCSSLASLDFSGNQFSGPLPFGLWSLSGLRSIDFSDNLLGGEIPEGIGNLKNLRVLRLRNNKLTGEVPDDIGDCSLLRSVDLTGNSFSGLLPSNLQKLSFCTELILSGNQFSGFMFEWIGKMKSLETLDLSGNNFTGQITDSFGQLHSLKFLNVSNNALVGSFPESLSACDNLLTLDGSHNSFTQVALFQSLSVLNLSDNQLSGSIPLEIGSVYSLISLSLSHNQITGSIPKSLSNLTLLQTVDFSFNKLTGVLPEQLSNLMNLRSFSISHNQLQGELPTSKFFNTINSDSISDNPSLCGVATNKTCLPKPIVLNPNSTDPTTPDSNSEPGHRKKILSISALIAIAAAAAILVGVISITVLNLRFRQRSATPLDFPGGYDFSRSPSSDGESGKLVMFSGDPDFSAGAHALLNKDSELGRGGFGAVYRTVLGNGRPVAIKKLTVSNLVKSKDDFEREVRKLGKVFHHNLVSLDGYYWTSSLQLLIYEFVSGGNLYKYLHEDYHYHLTWDERFSVILGVARGLSHLHQMSIIHCNLKSSNILISDSGESKVADYGIVGLLTKLDRNVLSDKIQSGLGYMAPEFGCKAVRITEKCDVYGFGILVLEVVSGKRPVEYMEDDVVVLLDMVREVVEEGRVEECVDFGLRGGVAAEEVIPVVKLGLMCTVQVPSARPDMAEVVGILEKMMSRE